MEKLKAYHDIRSNVSIAAVVLDPRLNLQYYSVEQHDTNFAMVKAMFAEYESVPLSVPAVVPEQSGKKRKSFHEQIYAKRGTVPVSVKGELKAYCDMGNGFMKSMTLFYGGKISHVIFLNFR
jgi:hypothetical protein